jgi:hypothetical protein
MPNRNSLLIATSAIGLAVIMLGQDTKAIADHGGSPTVAEPAERVDPASRQAFFGDLHLHTSFSYDAWGFGPYRLTPDDAYRFARGDAVNFLGKPVRRDVPLDFMAVTDHSEYMGMFNQLDDPNNPLSHDPNTKAYRDNPGKAFFAYFYHMFKGRPVYPLNHEQAMRDSWARTIAAANANYRPGRFTTFIGYEWTSMPGGENNLHRNVIFKGAHAPQPFTSRDSDRPEDLWSHLERARRSGMEVLAIPHNSNASNGLMFDWVDSDRRPIDEVYAQRRATNEPLAEIQQIKGGSETIPELSPQDEFANFERWDTLLTAPRPSAPHGSYLREGLGRGLVIQSRAGKNPYRYGFVGASDIHNALSASNENAFGGFDPFDPKSNMPDAEAVRKAFTPQRSLDFMQERETDVMQDSTRWSSAALTGVWAEQNSRDSIFSAFKRKETFATSGTRLKLRFFASWNFKDSMLQRRDWVATAYRSGVPMGGDLAPRGAGGSQAPAFVLWALKDPNDGNLDRIQVIKLWLDGGQYRERVFDVAWSGNRRPDPRTGRVPAVGNTVDLKTATYTNTIGATELRTVWRDPTFDPAKPAVYYARVLQIPTPRWTTYLAVARNLPLPQDSPPTLQERGWSSPIWYSPATRSRNGA